MAWLWLHGAGLLDDPDIGVPCGAIARISIIQAWVLLRKEAGHHKLEGKRLRQMATAPSSRCPCTPSHKHTASVACSRWHMSQRKDSNRWVLKRSQKRRQWGCHIIIYFNPPPCKGHLIGLVNESVTGQDHQGIWNANSC